MSSIYSLSALGVHEWCRKLNRTALVCLSLCEKGGLIFSLVVTFSATLLCGRQKSRKEFAELEDLDCNGRFNGVIIFPSSIFHLPPVFCLLILTFAYKIRNF
jgi:hypothetical protein